MLILVLNMTTLIELQNVKKHYQMGETRVKAIDGISIKINKGDFVAIMGPSGSGKSTFMNLVGSLDLPTEGEIYLDNNNISDLDESQLAQIRGKKIGFIFQSFNLIANLTAKENVMLPMIFQETEVEDREEQANKLFEQAVTVITDMYEYSQHDDTIITDAESFNKVFRANMHDVTDKQFETLIKLLDNFLEQQAKAELNKSLIN